MEGGHQHMTRQGQEDPPPRVVGVLTLATLALFLVRSI